MSDVTSMTEAGVSALVSHWEAGTWPTGQRRLHWYLLPEDMPSDTAAGVFDRFTRPGFDPVPSRWLHCTVVALLPALADVDRGKLDAMVETVRFNARKLAPINATGVLGAHHSAVMWELGPVDEFLPVFHCAVDASGSILRTDLSKSYRPHVTVAYSNARHETVGLGPLVRVDPSTMTCRFTSLALLNVRQENGCYQWDVVAEVPLGY